MRRPWGKDGAVHADPPLPRHLQLEVTAACNLRCRMCLVSYRPPQNRITGSMDLATFKRIVDELPEPERITLQGLGEPLLVPHLVDMVAYAVQRGAAVGFNTNGMLLSNERVEALIQVALPQLRQRVDERSLLRGLVFYPADTDPEVIGEAAMVRSAAPLRMKLPETWVLANQFGERHLELLLNLTVQRNGRLAPLDPADLRIGQGVPWQQAWGWLSQDVPAERALDATRLAARLLRNSGLHLTPPRRRRVQRSW
jgi:organic radical activating enzyme